MEHFSIGAILKWSNSQMEQFSNSAFWGRHHQLDDSLVGQLTILRVFRWKSSELFFHPSNKDECEDERADNTYGENEDDNEDENDDEFEDDKRDEMEDDNKDKDEDEMTMKIMLIIKMNGG